MTKKPNFESIQDTCTDVANYAIILKMLLEKTWVLDEGATAREFKVQANLAEELFIKKLADYSTKDLLEVGPPGVLSRLVDKMARLKNLLKDVQHTECIQFVQDGDFPLQAPAKDGDVGLDLFVAEDTIVPTNSSRPVDVPSKIKVKLPHGTWGLVINRSSAPRKLGIDVVLGCIDTGYTGPLYACCWNRTGEDITLKKGSRVAQVVLFGAVVPQIEKVEKLPVTQRGETGFGSTDQGGQNG
jgi:dUTP pyrophosphatase